MIRKLPKARIVNTGRSDPLEGILPDGLALKVISRHRSRTRR